MQSPNALGLLIGNWEGVLDHLLPVCQLIDAPLLLSEPNMLLLAETFYPKMDLLSWDQENKSLDGSIVEQYDTLMYAGHFRMPHGAFRFSDTLFHGKKRSIFCPHGSTDKRRNLYWIDALADEDLVLVYGEHMIDFIKEKGVWDRFSKAVVSGNYRYAYYQKHKAFFDQKIEAHLDLDSTKKTVLYAPTWSVQNKAHEWRVDNSSVFEIFPYIFDKIPSHYQLIVKWHPLLLENFADQIETIEKEYPHVSFLRHMPLVYPLFEKVDILLGDHSSIGYDFLLYDRPLFFLDCQESPGAHLQSCGHNISKEQLPNLYSIIEEYQPKTHSQA